MGNAAPPDIRKDILEPEKGGGSGVKADAGGLTEVQRKRLEEREKLRTSNFDALTSFFMALILFLGVFVFMLFILWLTLRMPERVKPIAPIIENAAGRADNAEGFERDFEPPGAEEVEELTEPTLQDTIEAVTDAVSSVAASLDTMNTNATASTSGTGKGDSRPPGPEGEGEDIVPRFERCVINPDLYSIAANSVHNRGGASDPRTPEQPNPLSQNRFGGPSKRNRFDSLFFRANGKWPASQEATSESSRCSQTAVEIHGR